MNEDKKEHLKMIEEIIKRMASNSFYMKGWAISLISAILIFANADNQIEFLVVAFLPLLAFWYLDAFYLQLEREYRTLYDEVLDDYLNSTNHIKLFDMNTKGKVVANKLRIMFSQSIGPIYITIGIAIIIVLLIGCNLKGV